MRRSVTRRAPAALAAVAITASAALAGCDGGSQAALPTLPLDTAVPTAAATPTMQLVAGDPSVSVRNAVIACREKNAPLLRALVDGEVPDGELESLFARGTDVQLRGHTDPPAEGGQAMVTVYLTITRESEIEDVERTWELLRDAAGVWRFASLPDCY